jgi:hypothetical protein
MLNVVGDCHCIHCEFESGSDESSTPLPLVEMSDGDDAIGLEETVYDHGCRNTFVFEQMYSLPSC